MSGSWGVFICGAVSGHFTAADTAAAALALAGYAIGIPAAVGQKSLQPVFYAHQDTRTPMFHALAAVGVAVGLALLLHPSLGIFAGFGDRRGIVDRLSIAGSAFTSKGIVSGEQGV